MSLVAPEGSIHAAWDFLDRLLSTLGISGMSSDSSTFESSTEEVYRVKILPWRNPQVTTLMDWIDSERTSATVTIRREDRSLAKESFSPQGSKPARRIRDDEGKHSSRLALQGLPIKLYDEKFVADLSPPFLTALSVSAEQFEWLEIMFG